MSIINLEVKEARRAKIESLTAELAKLLVVDQMNVPPGWQDRDDCFTKHIDAAHPIKTNEYWQYTLALYMVGNRQSKGALVELVCWLIREHDILKDAILLTPQPSTFQRQADEQTLNLAEISDAIL